MPSLYELESSYVLLKHCIAIDTNTNSDFPWDMTELARCVCRKITSALDTIVRDYSAWESVVSELVCDYGTEIVFYFNTFLNELADFIDFDTVRWIVVTDDLGGLLIH